MDACGRSATEFIMNAVKIASILLAQIAIGISIFLGFSSVKKFKPTFFSSQSIMAGACWILIAAGMGFNKQFFFAFGLLCLCAWWQFRAEKMVNGKMWLSIVAGLSASLGVQWLAAFPPDSIPNGCPPSLGYLFVSSIYIGGFLVAATYFTTFFVFQKEENSLEMAAAGFSVVLIAAAVRFIALLLTMSLLSQGGGEWAKTFIRDTTSYQSDGVLFSMRCLLGLIFPLLLSFLGWRLAKANRPRECSGIAVALALSVLLGEALAIYLRI